MPRIAILPLSLFLAFAGVQTAGAAYNLTTLHKFDQFGDFANGNIPATGVFYDSATDALFGTTAWGGDHQCHEKVGCGIVFALTRDSKGALARFARLHVFRFNENGGSDGDDGGSVVIDGAGNLYGTTQMGGDPGCGNGLGCGIVYMLEAPLLEKAKAKQRILHVFKGGDGNGPFGRLLIDANSGALYGTTYGGGTAGRGTVFSLTPTAGRTKWEFATLYNFQASPDGDSPTGALIMDSKGSLYGTTRYGGKGSYSGYGTVFSLTPVNRGWKEKILYDFRSHTGETPVAGLTADGKGDFFALTNPVTGQHGGGFALELVPEGTRLNARTIYKLHRKDGSVLYGDSLARDASANLFGVAAYGGTYDDGSVYELQNTNGTYTFNKLYDFCALAACSDGALPYGLFMDAGGNLYGTTAEGGINESGTVFVLSPGK